MPKPIANACGYCPAVSTVSLRLDGRPICWGCWESRYLKRARAEMGGGE